ncbi:MAG: hypothetical protein JOZ97_06375 [Candidatus Eremiobacteraeota bacterium]|nr:hypothetical protein [Candidatus Eremiobacteraeota bacterium]
MNLLRIAGAALAAAVASTAVVSAATGSYSTDYKPPKLSHLGKTSIPIAGSGTVIVKVLVKADGGFTVQNVIRSTNAADNAAALDIAKNSTYVVGTRGGKATTAFYDFTLKFSGKSVSSPDEQAVASSGEIGTINSMLKANNFVGAAAEFDKMSSIPARDRSAAAATYATAAVQLQKTNAQQALTYGQKAVSLQADSNTYFALGVAQLANNQNADAAANLKRAHDMGGGPRTIRERAVLDSYLIQAYNATGDTADANTISAELKRISPNTAANPSMPTLPDSFNQAMTAENAGKFDDAVRLYEQSAQTTPGIAVTAYSRAALAIGRMQPPDYRRMKAEADKALAINPNDAGANAAEGIAVVQLGIVNRDDGQKKQGLDILNKADAQAKAANITGLVNLIENFIKSVPQ